MLDHARYAGPAASILLVEDDFHIREVLGEILTAQGYRVIDAANGADALSRLRADDTPSLVLLDLRMPVMDGYEFLKRRDADSELRQIPVIILSATDVVAAAELRAIHPEIHSLRKPINLGLLFDLIRREIVTRQRQGRTHGRVPEDPPGRPADSKFAPSPPGRHHKLMTESAASLATAAAPDRSTVRVRVFSTTYCGWCRRAEQLLQQNGIRFELIDVTGDADARAALVEEAGGRRTVPVIFVDEASIGGYQELARLMAIGGLDHLKPRSDAAAPLPSSAD